MDHRHDAIPFATLEQAAEWFAVFRSGKVEEDERQRWQAWLASDASHRSAWARVEAISQGVSFAKEAPEAAGSALHAASQLRKRRKFIKTLVLTAVTAGLGWQVARQEEVQATLAGLGASHRTGVGESRKVVLADGTQLWLNTDTVLDQRYDDSQRLLVLHKGEILVETHPDTQQPPRPFIVRSRHGAMRALGTRFEVRQFDGHTQLGVSQGRVEITPADVPFAPRIINAGQETQFSRSQIAAAATLPATRQAWTQGMLIAQDLPLEQFLAELSRYRHGYLACDPAIASLRVVGGFPLRDTDQALAMLEAALPVQVRSVLPWWVSVKPGK
ncbi:FecR domain-containing protein [Duganella sp. sic0402]|uniref:FecR domain-containing protein n=1 Tax=Duganella sp. sic0402 TaxID=2854786 RepID=UPI001C43D23D|nr:FecR domain-containing protein [Duganella sp. sic0402]MBV7534701.1 FecR domain-containing protein [Duganella sp. sic0402]